MNLDDPKQKRKHRKTLARIEKERRKVVKELTEDTRLRQGDLEIRFNCREWGGNLREIAVHGKNALKNRTKPVSGGDA